MALKLYSDIDIQAIADAIRTKNGLSSVTYTVEEMAPAILALPVGGGGAVLIEDTLDENGGVIRTITAVSLAGDTVTAEHLEEGYTAHDAEGNAITGTLEAGGTAVAIEDTLDENGGTIRTITAVPLRGITVTAEHLEYGYTAVDSHGNLITGTLVV